MEKAEIRLLKCLSKKPKKFVGTKTELLFLKKGVIHQRFGAAQELYVSLSLIGVEILFYLETEQQQKAERLYEHC